MLIGYGATAFVSALDSDVTILFDTIMISMLFHSVLCLGRLLRPEWGSLALYRCLYQYTLSHKIPRQFFHVITVTPNIFSEPTLQ
jgi:hypothetical protein